MKVSNYIHHYELLTNKFGKSSDRSSSSTASLDRINSKLDYIEGNVQWVHKEINIMKNIFDQEHFINNCKLIAKKWKKK